MRRLIPSALLLLAILAAAPAAAEDPARVVIDGKDAVAWRICFEEIQEAETPGSPAPPQCIDSGQNHQQFPMARLPLHPPHLCSTAA